MILIGKGGKPVLNKLNQVTAYIEENLTEELSVEIIAQTVEIPAFHLRQLFFYLAGMTLSEYIKKRRLAAANEDLLNGERVTDIAFKYGYQSLDGFTRAFKKWSGYLPSEVMKTGLVKSFPKLSFIITVKGGIPMEFRIEEKPAFYLVGVSKRVPMQFEGVNQEIVKLAESITEAQRAEMHALQNIEPYEIVNASYDADANFLKEEGYLTHLIVVLTTKEEVSEQVDKVPGPAYTWAVFPNEGPFPSTLQQTMANIYAEWLPTSGYEVINAPSFSFTKMDQAKKDYAYIEIWIPVRKE